ncbi:Imm41 family immunity protein [Paenibacillus luteus]|uniref:Imm41 family immunity protein n=1 Tax=Paenibacillus luteus TaxID=2545753 RepID=UPI001141D249|nr:Imm41 family immunity protein [Paenibacillus luteus]
MKAVEVLKSNYEGTENSFIYFLHEQNNFNQEAFWDYFNCIVDITDETSNQNNLNRDLSQMVSKTYTFIMRSLLWHFHPKDLYMVENIPEKNLHLYIERLEFAYLGYFTGKVFKEELYDEDLINPKYKK